MRIVHAIVAATMTLTLGGSLRAGQANPPSSQTPSAVASPKGDSQRGKTLFDNYGCAACHGGEGQGSFAGPRVGPNPLAFPAFVRYIRAPRGTMPSYSEKLLKSEEDLADIHAHLSTREKPAPLSAMDQLGQR